MKNLNLIVIPALSVSLLAVVGCASHRSRDMSYSNTATPGYPALSGTGSEMSTAQRRVDITDSGPGTPRGDRASADPSEASSQGAGSRALVGEEHEPVSDIGGASMASSGGQSSGAALGRRTVTDLSGLTTADIGSPVQLQNAKVRAIVDPTVIALEAHGKPVFVHLQQPISGLREGDSLNVIGIVQSPSQASLGATTLTADASHVLGAQDFFIHAQNASKSQ